MSKTRAVATVKIWRRLTRKGVKVTPGLERAAAEARVVLGMTRTRRGM